MLYGVKYLIIHSSTDTYFLVTTCDNLSNFTTTYYRLPMNILLASGSLMPLNLVR